jgi:uncharacterized membrane protein SpoIIM required for sporulation
MIEMLIRPRKAERHPWEMLFVGLFYASVAFLLVTFVFGKDFVLSDGSGLLLVVFTVICCFPFIYYIIKLEEGKDIQINDSGKLIKEHSKALFSLMWLFLGLVIAFSFWYIAMPERAAQNFNFQIKTFCAINSANNYDACLNQYGIPATTGSATSMSSFISIFSNNIYVLIFTLLFSLVFGAGAIFILVWNASVIASAVGIFARGQMTSLPMGIIRYMIHGIPEIAAYFIGGLAGGLISVAMINHQTDAEQFVKVLKED